MPKSGNTKGMHKGEGTKSRGRTAITKADPFAPTRPNVSQTMEREATRPITAGGGAKHRGDRRDTSRAYTGNARNPSHAGNPRRDTKTRKR